MSSAMGSPSNKPKPKHKFPISLIVLTLVALFGIIYFHQLTEMLGGAPAENGMPSTRQMRSILTGRSTARFNVELISCHEEKLRKTDWCEVTDQKGTVLFKGDFLPVGTVHRAPQSELAIRPFDSVHGWVRGPSEALPVPVVPLKDGTLLVPAPDTFKLKKRWAEHPEELAEVSGSSAAKG